jgi:hypothetical protein
MIIDAQQSLGFDNLCASSFPKVAEVNVFELVSSQIVALERDLRA